MKTRKEKNIAPTSGRITSFSSPLLTSPIQRHDMLSYPNLGSFLSTQVVEKIEQVSEVIDFQFKIVFTSLHL